jgi:hypothetical protein
MFLLLKFLIYCVSTQNTSLPILFNCSISAIVCSGNAANPHVLDIFNKVHNPLHLPRETTSQPPKMVRTPSVLYIPTSKKKVVRYQCVFYILTLKYVSYHNHVYFFYISISENCLNLIYFTRSARCFQQRRFTLSTLNKSKKLPPSS